MAGMAVDGRVAREGWPSLLWLVGKAAAGGSAALSRYLLGASRTDGGWSGAAGAVAGLLLQQAHLELLVFSCSLGAAAGEQEQQQAGGQQLLGGGGGKADSDHFQWRAELLQRFPIQAGTRACGREGWRPNMPGRQKTQPPTANRQPGRRDMWLHAPACTTNNLPCTHSWMEKQPTNAICAGARVQRAGACHAQHAALVVMLLPMC